MPCMDSAASYWFVLWWENEPFAKKQAQKHDMAMSTSTNILQQTLHEVSSEGV